VLLGPVLAKAQLLEGTVTDDKGAPIAFANVYLEDLASGVATDDTGAFSLRLERGGVYRVITSAVGYVTGSDSIFVEASGATRVELSLKPDVALLEEVVVRAAKRDSGYVIMREVAQRRREYLRETGPYRAEVYVKAREDVARRIKRGKRDRTSLDDLAMPQGDPSSIEAQLDPDADSVATEFNLLELRLRLNVAPPNGYKEERLARSVYGSGQGLYVPLFGDADINFYRSRIDFGGLTKTTIVSPLSPIGVLNYKFRLVDTRRAADGQRIYEIEFKPRKRGNATASGTLIINDSLFNLREVVAELPQSGLRIFDALEVTQRYEEVAPDVWLPARQQFAYETRLGQRERFRGTTTLAFSDFELDYAFPPRFFNGEVATVDALAYKRDSIYWRGYRPEPLAMEEAEKVRTVDSMRARVNSVAYKDSVEAAYNRITPLELLWEGIGFRDHRRREVLNLPSIPSLIGFDIIGGWRLRPWAGYFRRFPNEQSMSFYGQASYGFQRRDWLGTANLVYRYDPRRLSDISVSGGRSFGSIFDGDGIRNQLSRSNYILLDRFAAAHRTELLNGLYLRVGGEYADRKPAPIDNSETFFSELLDDDPPEQFETYQAAISDVTVSFTPFQRYLSEPARKVVLGSDWPTISLTHRKAWRGVLSSDIDFDYLEAAINQRLELGAIGNMLYSARAGQFVNTRDVRFVDVKRFRRSDPLLFFDPLLSFQSLDTSLATTKPFLELHAVHHFNGALINNLPLVRKLRIEAAAGAGILWLGEGDGYRYEELFFGLERIFKLGPRRRMRLGVYGVFSNSVARSPFWEPKVSIDIIDTWKRAWSF